MAFARTPRELLLPDAPEFGEQLAFVVVDSGQASLEMTRTQLPLQGDPAPQTGVLIPFSAATFQIATAMLSTTQREPRTLYRNGIQWVTAQVTPRVLRRMMRCAAEAAAHRGATLVPGEPMHLQSATMQPYYVSQQARLESPPLLLTQ